MPEMSDPRDMGNWIGITVALLSAFMAVTKVKDDNIVQAMMQAKSDAVDSWSEYQAKKIKRHHELNTRDDQFDLSDASLSISLGVLGIAALTRKNWLLGLSWFFGAFGLLMGLAGLSGWTIHPDWLVRLLS